MKKISFLMVFCLFFLHYTTTFAEPQPPTINSKSIFIASAVTPQVIYQNNAKETFSPGALVHIMPAIIALEKGDAEETVEISADLAKYSTPSDTNISLKSTEKFTVKQLVQAMLVGNADDAANALALHISKGDMPAFIEMMNARAAELGAYNTNFTNVTGNFDANQRSTAEDMALIYRKAYSMPTLQAALKMKATVLPATSLSSEKALRTNNYIADNYLQTKYYYSYAIGGKVGYYGSSVCNIAAFATKGGADVICVVMGGSKVGDDIMSFYDAKLGFEYTFDNYQLQTAVSLGEIMHDAKISGAKGRDRLNLVADDSLDVLVLKGDEANVQKQVDVSKKTFRAPVQMGENLGSVKVSYNNVEISTIPLVASETIYATAFGSFGKLMATIFASKFVRFLACLALIWLIYNFFYLRPKRMREARKTARRQKAEERRKELGF